MAVTGRGHDEVQTHAPIPPKQWEQWDGFQQAESGSLAHDKQAHAPSNPRQCPQWAVSGDGMPVLVSADGMPVLVSAPGSTARITRTMTFSSSTPHSESVRSSSSSFREKTSLCRDTGIDCPSESRMRSFTLATVSDGSTSNGVICPVRDLMKICGAGDVPAFLPLDFCA